MHKSGFVSIIGKPNVGKSSLLNCLLKENLSITSPKVQTTRKKILGILNNDDFQIIFSDTPGIITPNYLLQETMMDSVNKSLIGADAILFVTDIFENNINMEIFNTVKISTPIIIIINKIDLSNQEKVNSLFDLWKEKYKTIPVIPVSALIPFNVETIISSLLEFIPEAPPYYPKDQISELPEKFFIAEFIRQQIYLQYRKEIPYCCEVQIENFEEQNDLVKINAIIFVERESQKGILIGSKGEKLKNVVSKARFQMEKFLHKRVFLKTMVKVEDGWNKDKLTLEKWGYFL